MVEQVFAAPRAAFFGGAWPQGFVPLDPTAGERFLAALQTRGRFLDRGRAELDPDFKQPIPYCLIATDAGRLLVVRRRRQGSEARLHGQFSVGLGGHLGPEDGPPLEPAFVGRGLRRELEEELVLPLSALRREPAGPLDPPGATLEMLGLINDDSNAVGQVHVGIVFRLTLPAPAEEEVRVREISKLEGAFQGLPQVRELWQYPRHFESWSQIVLGELFFAPRPRGDRRSATESA